MRSENQKQTKKKKCEMSSSAGHQADVTRLRTSTRNSSGS